MTTPFVSIVTPVHNTAPFLAHCIESVLRQTHQHWEYVIVDNASSDGSGDIARRYASNDARIRVVRYDELLPQVPNYNRALSLVAPGSRYVKVLEADNWLFEGCLHEMIRLAEANPSVGVVSSYNTTETRIRMTALPLAETIIPGREAARRQLRGDQYLFGAPTTVLLKASLVRERTPYYDETCLIAEDQSACLDALRTSDLGFVPQVLSFIRTENDSILSKIKGFNAQELDRVALIRKHGKDFFEPDELGRIESRLLNQYYDALAIGALKRQSMEYWTFHRKGLASVGLQLDRMRLTKAIAKSLIKRPLSPLQFWRGQRTRHGSTP